MRPLREGKSLNEKIFHLKEIDFFFGHGVIKLKRKTQYKKNERSEKRNSAAQDK